MFQVTARSSPPSSPHEDEESCDIFNAQISRTGNDTGMLWPKKHVGICWIWWTICFLALVPHTGICPNYLESLIHSTGWLQIGRSTESPIDFVVTDTVAGGQEGEETPITQSTISRFACRVVCERSPPYTARIYAAGFDSSKNIFLGVITLQRAAIDSWHLHLRCCLNQRLAVDAAPFSNPSVFTRKRR